MYIDPYYFSRRKRWFDSILASMLLIVLFPLLVGIYFLVFVTAGKPVFFTQKRFGKNKQSFPLYKFRTMYVGAHRDREKYRSLSSAPKPMFKVASDPRFVGIGRLLSQSGLDELPQLLNILQGEMSFVGPRPLPLEESRALPASWDFRYRVKPGIFSEWALSAGRHTSLHSWQLLEKKTLQRGSIVHDLLYIVRSLRILLLIEP